MQIVIVLVYFNLEYKEKKVYLDFNNSTPISATGWPHNC